MTVLGYAVSVYNQILFGIFYRRIASVTGHANKQGYYAYTSEKHGCAEQYLGLSLIHI